MAVKYLRVVWAVHRLECVLLVFASGDAEEFISKFFPVARGYVEVLFGDVWNRDARISMLGAECPDVVVELVAHNGSLGCPKGKSRAHELRESEEVELCRVYGDRVSSLPQSGQDTR